MKTNEQLLDELAVAQERIAELQSSVAKRNRTVDTLRKSEEYYQFLAENVNDVLWTVDKGLRFTYVSPSIKKLSGFTVEEAMKRSFGELLSPSSFFLVKEAFEEQLEYFDAPDGPARPLKVELEHLRKDGSMGWSEVDMTFLRGSLGDFTGIVGVSRDISERKRAVKALQKSQRTRSTLANNLPRMTYQCQNNRDRTMRILGEQGFFLPGLLPLEPDKADTFAFGSMIHPDDRESVWEDIQTAIRAKESFQLVYRIRADTEEVKWVWEQGRAVFSPDSELQTLEGFITDITESKTAELELKKYQQYLEELVSIRSADLTNTKKELARMQRLESLGALTGGIAHDFGNLLTAILGNISLVKQSGAIGEPASGVLREAEKASRRAMNLTRQLLTFAKGGEPVKRTVSLAQLLRETPDLFAGRSDVVCEFSIPEGLWPVEVDEGQFSQVIQNLILNAVEAMPEGGVVRINASNHVQREGSDPLIPGGRHLLTSIRDQGTGIPREIQGRIFDPFFSTKQQGSGLGLPVAHSIIKKHQGQMTVESEPDAGTVFHIYLPACEEATSQGPDPQRHHDRVPDQGT